MDVLSALIAYEQKLTMSLSSSSFYCRLLGSKTWQFCVSVQIPLSGALPVRGDGLRSPYNGNGVGRWTNSDSTKGARYQQHTRVYTQLAEMEGFQLILLSFAVLTDEPVRRQLRSEGMWHGVGGCPTACAALLRPGAIFGSPSVPRTDETLYPWTWCAEWKELYTPSLSKDPYVSQLYLFASKKIFCICYHLLTSNIPRSDIGITVGTIRLKN